ncbi:MAG TPA: methylenetetrahydrofolate reductase [NAD(P)H], partial [Cytophagales bacterium]|nr:methylenetetrahydrofolate reductase [NAD(P)H] [Cytophagales bacterium]
VDMNRGKYLEEDSIQGYKTDFNIGVAGYPEKHFESPNLKSDLRHLKEKVDAGADYIVTQMFFDNKKYFEFVELCRAADINIPILPGVKPITTKSQANILPTIFHIDLPEQLADEVEKCKDNAAVREVGIEWAVAQSKELISKGVPSMHFYSMGKSDPIYRIAKELF